MNIHKVFLFTLSVIWLPLATADVIDEIPTDEVLKTHEDIEQASEKLSEEAITQLENSDVQDDLKDKVLEATVGDYVKLTDEEQNILSRMGMSQGEIDSIDFVNNPKQSKVKLTNQIQKYANNKQKEVKKVVLQDGIPGLGSSVLGLTFATFLGPLVGMKCWDQTSAKVFAGTSLTWIGLEMMSWDNYKFELQELSALGNTTRVTVGVKALAQKIISLHEEIKTELKTTDGKPTEQVDEKLVMLQGKIGELRAAVQKFQKEFANFSDSQVGALNKLKKSIALIQKNTAKKVKSATIAGAGFAVSSGLAFAEQYNLIGKGGSCVVDNPNTQKGIMEYIIPSAVAGVKEKATANFDKLGIPIGGGLLAAYIAFKGKFLTPIFASGTSRGITFGVMAGIAGVAAWKMKRFSDYLGEQTELIDDLIRALKKRMDKTDELISDGDSFLQFVEQVIISQARDVVKKVDEIVDDLEGNVDKMKEEVDTVIDGMDEVESSSLYNLLENFAISKAYAGKGKKSLCLVGKRNIRLDKNCRCRSKNKCTSIKLTNVNGVKNQITKKLIESSHYITRGLKYISYGFPKKAEAYFLKIDKGRKDIDKVNQYFLKKTKKKGLNSAYFDRVARQEIKKLEAIGEKSLGKSFSPPRRLAKQTGFKFNNKKKDANRVNMIKLKNMLLIKEFLSDNKSQSRRGRGDQRSSKPELTFNEEDLLEGLNDIEEDRSLNLFKIISRRYNIIYHSK
jgi:hypothetical protein